jgi:hypothetical protein
MSKSSYLVCDLQKERAKCQMITRFEAFQRERDISGTLAISAHDINTITPAIVNEWQALNEEHTLMQMAYQRGLLYTNVVRARPNQGRYDRELSRGSWRCLVVRPPNNGQLHA